MAYPQQQFQNGTNNNNNTNVWGQFVNPEYNRLQSQIQQQTQALLRERQQLSGTSNGGGNSFIVQQPYLRPVESQKYLKLNSDRSYANNNNGNMTNNQTQYMNNNFNNNLNNNFNNSMNNNNFNNSMNPNIYNPSRLPTHQQPYSQKVRQLMQLCKKDNSQLSNELMRVLSEQKNVYNQFLSNGGQSSQKTQYFGVNNPIMQAQKESSVNFNSRAGQGNMGNNNMYSNTSSGNHTPQRGGSAGFIQMNGNQGIDNNTNQKQPQQQQIIHATLGKNDNQNNNFFNNNNNNNLIPRQQLGDDLIQMIEQIQRKALNEIQKLREQKIDLMKQLKQQIQGNNQLQKEVNTMAQQLQQQSRSQASNNKINMNQQQNQSLNNNNNQQLLQQQILNQIRFEMDNLRRQNQNLRNFNNNNISNISNKQFVNVNNERQRLSLQQQQQQQQHERQYSHLVNATQQQQRQRQNYQRTSGFNHNQMNTLRQTVAVLQAELRAKDQMIRQLTLQVARLNQQGGTTSNYQIASLLEQGEAIRQQTLQLCRLKQSQQQKSSTLFINQNIGYNNNQGTFPFSDQQRIRQLQQLLQREQEEKQNFLNDLLAFKEKYQQLEEENRLLKRQSKMGSSEIARFSPIYDKSTVGQGVGNSVDDYERILSEMRGVARY